jgi:glutamate--cysteine ligase
MIDAQRGDGWVVPAAVTSALLSDAAAGEAATAAVAPMWAAARAGPDPWLIAARNGVDDTHLSRASRACFKAARGALARQDTPPGILAAVDAFIDRYVSKDRCPADDLLEEVE